MRQILTVWKKELRDTIRDRRTLVSMVLMPMVVMPLIVLGMNKLTVSQFKKMAEQHIQLAIENEDAAPYLVELIKKEASADIVKVKDPIVRAVKEGQVDIGIIIPTDFQAKIKAEQPVEITIVKKSTNQLSNSATARVNALLEPFNKDLVEKRLSRYGLNPTMLTGVDATTQDVATDKQRGGFGLGLLLPLFIMMWALIGGQYTAIDASAGEKERKTLVALFLTPVQRVHIIIGKFLAVATVALSSVAISIISMFVAVRYSFSSDASVDFSLDLKALLWIFLVSFLLVLMFSALLLSLGIFAKTFKEAQSYISPLYIIILLPISLINMIPNLKLSAPFFLLPGINAMSLFKEIFVGTYNAVHIALTVGSLALSAIITIVVTTYLYQKESVLFKG